MPKLPLPIPVMRGWTLAVLLGAGSWGCTDAVGGDGDLTAQLAINPVLPSALATGFFDLDIDRVRIRLIRPPAEPVLDTTMVFPADSTRLSVRLRVPLVSRSEQLLISLDLRSGQQLMFTGSREIEVSDAGSVAPSVPLQYVGPGQQVNSIRIEPRDSVLKPGDAFNFQVFGFQNGLPVDEFYVGWASADPETAPIDATGSIRAPGNRGSVIIRAITPSGIIDSTRLWFAPPPAAMTMVGGNNQIGFAGSQLGALLAVRLVATDGIGVPGVRVRYTAPFAGSVRDPIAISDADGVARTVARLSTIAGPQQFTATADFQSPITFNMLATAGPAARILRLGGHGQTGIVGALLNQPLVASVTDVFGNPVAGAPVTWTITAGDGTLEEVSLETNANGLANALFRLGGTPGINAVRAAVGPPSLTVDFSATGTLGGADSIAVVSGDSASAPPNTTLPPFVVKVTDRFGNAIGSVLVTWEILSGNGQLSTISSLSNASGIASTIYQLGPGFGEHKIEVRIPSGFSYVFTATGVP